MKFVVPEENLPYEFLEKLEIDIESLFNSFLEKKDLKFDDNKYDEILFVLYDELNEKISELSSYTNEIDESSGTWGHSMFHIDNLEEIKSEFEKYVKEFVEEIK